MSVERTTWICVYILKYTHVLGGSGKVLVLIFTHYNSQYILYITRHMYEFYTCNTYLCYYSEYYIAHIQ